MCIDQSACLRAIERLREREQLEELGAYLLAIDSWKDHDTKSPEFAVYRGARDAFRALVWPKIRLIHALIEEGQWGSMECQAIHKKLQGAHPMFAGYDATVYARVVAGEDANPVEDDEGGPEREWSEWCIDEPDDEPDELDGYRSDDSDDEFEEDLLEVYDDPRDLTIEEFGFPKEDRPSERRKKKKWLSRRARAKSQLDLRNKKAERLRALEAKVTFRYQGKEIEPDPDLLITRVREVREGDDQRERQQIAMAAIHHGPDEWTPQAERDFQAAKKAFAAGDTDALRGLETKFCLAQYRGITFKTSTFDSRARQISRHEDERGRAIYSMSVLHAAGVSPTDYFRGNCSQEELGELDRIARELKQVLLAKREIGPVEVGGIRFDSHADAIQHIYTNQYDYFHSSVARYLANREEWEKDLAGGLARARAEARTTEEARTRTAIPAEMPNFNGHVRSLAGLSRDYAGYGSYLQAHGLVADEPSFKQAARKGQPLSTSHTRDQYSSYAQGKSVFSFADYLKLHDEFASYEPGYDGWIRYVADIAERNEEALVKLEDEAQAAYLKKKYGFVPPDDWVLFDGLRNGYCPLVSTGDNPRHALKYAYGMKFYAGHYHERLKPSWDEQGRARRPYIGKVYCSLHPLEEYIDDAPNHVPSMNMHARIIIGDLIADEREATFPAYIPGGRTVLEHVAKIPSFLGETPEDGYRDAHLRKYGIDREDFAELHALLRQAQETDARAARRDAKGKQPEKGEGEEGEREEPEEAGLDSAVDWFLQRLCAWLVNYQEVRLVEIARRLALAQGRLLVYRNSLGELDRSLSSTVVNGVRLPGDRGLEGQDPMELRKNRRYVHVSDPANKQAIIDKERSTWSQPRRDLRTRLAENYVVHATAGDGNCLFHALAGVQRLTLGRFLDHRAIREELVHAMRRQPELEALRQQYGLDGPYLDEMAQVCTDPGQLGRWGGDPEIHAFCWLHGLRIRVYASTYPGPDHCTEFGPRGDVRPRATGYLLHVHGNHWEYLEQR